jgi:hypothetical protein
MEPGQEACIFQLKNTEFLAKPLCTGHENAGHLRNSITLARIGTIVNKRIVPTVAFDVLCLGFLEPHKVKEDKRDGNGSHREEEYRSGEGSYGFHIGETVERGAENL